MRDAKRIKNHIEFLNQIAARDSKKVYPLADVYYHAGQIQMMEQCSEETALQVAQQIAAMEEAEQAEKAS